MAKDILERVQKILAQRGFGSRRQIEELIAAGEVFVNGQPAILGSKASASDNIVVQGKTVACVATNQRVILYHKPLGQICTRSDPEGRPTVFDDLPKLKNQRWVAVGRLDINSSGLILLTTDGELANKLMHPSADLEREYAVRVLGDVTDKIIKNITQGVTLDDGTKAKFTKVIAANGHGVNSWYYVTLKQGRYREVRRIWQSQGLQVSRLIRVKYGRYTLPKDLDPGKYLELDYVEVVNGI